MGLACSELKAPGVRGGCDLGTGDSRQVPLDRGNPAGHVPSQSVAPSHEDSHSEPWLGPGVRVGNVGRAGLLRGLSWGKEPKNSPW